MAYTVLARRYRSTSFGGVIGQEPIARTLRNAIATDRVAHAYLFTGTRGVGKTSMARIFACALNAPDAVEDAPTPETDHEFPPVAVQQRMVEAIMRGDDLNVIEIDGASNNSVENARQLISNASLSPTGQARFKVYIIDEVHMLSTAAFNALLKTMEEPPPHVKFILCTTEPHKVLPTIQSRCQRFDFRNIPTRQIAEHLGRVLAAEGREAEEQVLWQVARLAAGSMRDGLSLLDRLLATGESPLTMQVLEQMFGLPNEQLLETVVDAIAAGDVAATLRRADELRRGGIAQDQLLDVLIERFRQLMLIAACGADSELIELSDEARQRAAEQAQRFDAAALTYLIALCENVQRQSRASSNPAALFEAAMVRMALAEKMADVAALLSGKGVGGDGEKKKPGDEPARLNVSLAPRANAPRTQAAPPTLEPATVRSQTTQRYLQNGGSTSSAAPSRPGRDEGVSDTDDADELWRRLQQRAGARPAFAWLRFVELVSCDGQTLVLSPRSGHREVLGFARNERILGALTDELRELAGRTMRIAIRPRKEADGSAGASAEPSPAGPDRQEAMNLPLVRAAMEAFPDATLVNVRGEASGRTTSQAPENEPTNE